MGPIATSLAVLLAGASSASGASLSVSWSNSSFTGSATPAVSQSSSGVPLVTAASVLPSGIAPAEENVVSTIYSTITSCPPEVTSCPARLISIGESTYKANPTAAPKEKAGDLAPDASVSGTPAPQYTKSTIYSTITHTSCPPTVTKCPAKGPYVEVITTVTLCPVSPTATPKAASPASASDKALDASVSGTPAPQPANSTIYSTITHTSCPPTVTKCPAKGPYVEVVTIVVPCSVSPTAAPNAAPSAPAGDKAPAPAPAPASAPKPTSLPQDSAAAPAEHPPEVVVTQTKVSTITACPPVVSDCPLGKPVTKFITSTITCSKGAANPVCKTALPADSAAHPVDKTVHPANSSPENPADNGAPADRIAPSSGNPVNAGDHAAKPINKDGKPQACKPRVRPAQKAADSQKQPQQPAPAPVPAPAPAPAAAPLAADAPAAAPAPALASSFKLASPTGSAAPSGGLSGAAAVPMVTSQAAAGKAVSTVALAMGVLAAALFL